MLPFVKIFLFIGTSRKNQLAIFIIITIGAAAIHKIFIFIDDISDYLVTRATILQCATGLGTLSSSLITPERRGCFGGRVCRIVFCRCFGGGRSGLGGALGGALGGVLGGGLGWRLGGSLSTEPLPITINPRRRDAAMTGGAFIRLANGIHSFLLCHQRVYAGITARL